MSNLSQAEWLAQISEEIIDPKQRIIDPHHHLWPGSAGGRQYLLDDLWADTGSGHNVTNTVFIDCSQCYWNLEDAALNPVGETEFVKELADASKADPNQATISGIVGHVDMLLGFEAEESFRKSIWKLVRNCSKAFVMLAAGIRIPMFAIRITMLVKVCISCQIF